MRQMGHLCQIWLKFMEAYVSWTLQDFFWYATVFWGMIGRQNTDIWILAILLYLLILTS